MPDRPPKRTSTEALPVALRSKDQPPDPQDDRRSGARFPCAVAAEVFEPISHARIMGRTTDLGIGGCYVDTINPFPVGTRLRIRLTDHARQFEAFGQVIFAQMGMGMGIAFTEIGADDLESLRKWLGELSGEMPARQPLSMPSLQEYAIRPGVAADQPATLTERLVLNELISLLIRKHVLTEAEGSALLRELYR